VLDAGCGSGRVMNRLAELYPNSNFTGIDLSPEAIGMARAEASQKGLRNIGFFVRDLTDFDAAANPVEYDLITTFDAVHDQASRLMS
jgi:cyclopropane fatty-acyl-phospholipid synthase-like methyltransferase